MPTGKLKNVLVFVNFRRALYFKTIACTDPHIPRPVSPGEAYIIRACVVIPSVGIGIEAASAIQHLFKYML